MIDFINSVFWWSGFALWAVGPVAVLAWVIGASAFLIWDLLGLSKTEQMDFGHRVEKLESLVRPREGGRR